MTSVSRAEFAWAGGDSPGDLLFNHEIKGPLKDSTIQAIAEAFPSVDSSTARLYALRQVEGPAGRYRLTGNSGDWFVRVTPRFGEPALEKSIIDYLLGQGVSVNWLLISGAKLEWHGCRYRVDLRPFVEGRHFDGSDDDLRNITGVLFRCHQALAKFPRSEEIRAAAAARNQRLAAIVDDISDALNSDNYSLFMERADWARRNRIWLQELVNEFNPRLDLLPNAQCVHGELHRANVLFRRNDGQALLIDFEEATSLWMPTSWDVAFMFQRFCLRNDPTNERALQWLSVVSENYGDTLPSLVPIMRQIAWFTVVSILGSRIYSGVDTPAEEYDKFVRLEHQAREYEGIL